jgi:hypothetical protein
MKELRAYVASSHFAGASSAMIANSAQSPRVMFILKTWRSVRKHLQHEGELNYLEMNGDAMKMRGRKECPDAATILSEGVLRTASHNSQSKASIRRARATIMSQQAPEDEALRSRPRNTSERPELHQVHVTTLHCRSSQLARPTLRINDDDDNENDTCSDDDDDQAAASC